MKIVYFTDSLLFSIAGISNSVINLSKGLQKNGNRITIIAPNSAKQVPRKNLLKGIALNFFPSIESPWNPRLRIGSPLSPKIYKLTKKINPNLLHFHTPFLMGAGAIVMGKSLKKPVVGTFHSYFMEPEYLKSAGIKVQTDSLTNFLWKYAAFFYNQCDAVIAPSESVKKDLIKYGVRKPIHIISNALNEKELKIATSAQVEKLKKKLSLNRNVILYVGRLSHEKSLDILLKSFAKVTIVAKDTSLLLIGEGKIESDLKSLVKRLKVQDKVIFAGSINQETLLSQGYFQLADVFVTASGSETQGITLIEAMFFGVPLVGVSKKGVLDMVKNVGLLAKPNNVNDLADKIIKVIKNQSLRRKLSHNSKNTYRQKYSTTKVVKQVEKLYKQLSK